MFENIFTTYTNYRWLRIACRIGLPVCGLLLIVLSGGFPPFAWRFLAHVIATLPALWTMRGLLIVLPFIGLLLQSFLLLVLWIAWVFACIKVIQYEWAAFQERQHFAQEVQEEAELAYATMRVAHPSSQLQRGQPVRTPTTARVAAQASAFDALPDTVYPRMPSSARRYPGAAVTDDHKGPPPSRHATPVPTVVPARASAHSVATYEPIQRPEEVRQGYQDRRLHSDNVVHSDEYDDLPNGLEIYGTFADDFDEDEEERAGIEKVNTRPPGESLEEESQRGLLEEGSQLRLVVGLGSDPGVARKDAPNEDSVLALQGTHIIEAGTVPVGLFVVADGMGGHANGQEASRIAIRSMSDVVAPVLLNSNAEEELGEELLKDGAQHANFAIYQRNQPDFMMGTTLTSALIFGSTAHIINVGDSRTYVYRASRGLTQITRDHSHVWQLFEAGLIKHEDIYTHPERNQIARCMGEHVRAEIDVFKVSLQSDDVLLLCSDGLWEMVRDPEIEQIIKGNAPHAPQVSAKLIETALRNGGADNVSAVVVCVVS